MARAKAKSKARAKPEAEEIPFRFFGAGAATYYEAAYMSVVFRTAPSRAVKQKLERGIPQPLRTLRWIKRTLRVGTAEYALAGWTSFDAFNAAIERWLHECHAIAPIDFAFRAEDTEAGTELSAWHHASMAAALDLAKNLAKRYDDDATRDHVKRGLLDMMKAAGIAIPATLDPVPRWRTALEAGDGETFGRLMSRNWEDLQLVLDVRDAMHRRAMLGSRPTLERDGRFDGQIFQMALIDGSDASSYVIERMLARAATKPFWATMCAADAAKVLKDAPEAVLTVLDRLVELGTSAGIVVENALWATEELGPSNVSPDRLERYWAIAVNKLADWPALHPYLVRLAPVLGREPPPRAVRGAGR